ncbi:MAG: HupE/UreJ family protein [Burkholderiales bacterium]|nr:HupE/UreJ family protein [Burkholderiales bacterium]
MGLGVIAIAASCGLAHGAETPDTGFVGDASGFLLTTAALHLGGVGSDWYSPVAGCTQCAGIGHTGRQPWLCRHLPVSQI